MFGIHCCLMGQFFLRRHDIDGPVSNGERHGSAWTFKKFNVSQKATVWEPCFFQKTAVLGTF
jgi:hypothetical protein